MYFLFARILHTNFISMSPNFFWNSLQQVRRAFSFHFLNKLGAQNQFQFARVPLHLGNQTILFSFHFRRKRRINIQFLCYSTADVAALSKLLVLQKLFSCLDFRFHCMKDYTIILFATWNRISYQINTDKRKVHFDK